MDIAWWWVVVAAPIVWWVLLRWCFGRIHALPEPDEVLSVETGDGWTLPIHRHLPKDPQVPGPVIVLGHGLTMGRACWALSPGGGLLQALLDLGHEVWVPSYRGDADTLAPSRDERWRWSFEHHADLDVPAIAIKVSEVAGERGFCWVGHSMGGMLGYVAFGRMSAPRLRGLVTIGSPMRFGGFPIALGAVSTLLRGFGRVPLRWLARYGLPGALAWPRLWAGFAVRFEHLDLRERATFFGEACRDTSAPLLAFFAELAGRGSVLCAPTADPWEGSPPWAPGVALLSRIPCAVLVLAGEADRLASPGSAGAAARIGGARFELRTFGPRGDGGVALGHQDLISSRGCRERVAPAISSWIRQQPGS